MRYEIQTPIILESVEAARSVINGLQDGSMEANTGSKIVGAARVLQSGVTVDIKARLAGPKIAAFEKKAAEDEAKTRKP